MFKSVSVFLAQMVAFIPIVSSELSRTKCTMHARLVVVSWTTAYVMATAVVIDVAYWTKEARCDVWDAGNEAVQDARTMLAWYQVHIHTRVPFVQKNRMCFCVLCRLCALF